MAVDLRVVSGFPPGQVFPTGVCGGDQDEADRYQEPLGAEKLRHHFPPKMDLIVFSALPVARASAASATFKP